MISDIHTHLIDLSPAFAKHANLATPSSGVNADAALTESADNAREGRRSEVAWGRSFVEVFDEAYPTAGVSKATEVQHRLSLLAAENVAADRNTGAVWLEENEFWADWMHEVAGQRVIIRVDPEACWDGAHIYSTDNAYLGFALAPCASI